MSYKTFKRYIKSFSIVMTWVFFINSTLVYADFIPKDSLRIPFVSPDRLRTLAEEVQSHTNPESLVDIKNLYVKWEEVSLKYKTRLFWSEKYEILKNLCGKSGLKKQPSLSLYAETLYRNDDFVQRLYSKNPHELRKRIKVLSKLGLSPSSYLLRYSSETIKSKAKLLRRYKLPLNTATIRLSKDTINKMKAGVSELTVRSKARPGLGFYAILATLVIFFSPNHSFINNYLFNKINNYKPSLMVKIAEKWIVNADRGEIIGLIEECFRKRYSPQAKFWISVLANNTDKLPFECRGYVEELYKTYLSPSQDSLPYEEWLSPENNPDKIIGVRMYMQDLYRVDIWKRPLLEMGFKEEAHPEKKQIVFTGKVGDISYKITVVYRAEEEAYDSVEILKERNDGKLHWIIFNGHTDMERNLWNSWKNAPPLSDSSNTLLVQVAGCLSMNELQRARASTGGRTDKIQFIGTTEEGWSYDGRKIFLAILREGIPQRLSWDQVDNFLARQNFKYPGNYVLPNDLTQEDYVDTDGDGISDKRDIYQEFGFLDIPGEHTFDFRQTHADPGDIRAGKLFEAIHYVNNSYYWDRSLNKFHRRIESDGWFNPEDGSKQFMLVEKVNIEGRDVFRIKINIGFSHCSQEILTMKLIHELNVYFTENYRKKFSIDDEMRGIHLVSEYAEKHCPALFASYIKSMGYPKTVTLDLVSKSRPRIADSRSQSRERRNYERQIKTVISAFLARRPAGTGPGTISVVREESAGLSLKNLIEISKRPDCPDSVDTRLRHMCLEIIAGINDLHNSPDEVRFKSVEGNNPELLYSLMVYGENEMFPSTFKGLFIRMLDKMAEEGLTAKSLFEKMGYNKFRTMIKLCAGFNRLNEFLDTVAEQDQIELLERVVRIKGDEKDLVSRATTIADIFGIVESENVLKVLQRAVKEEYETAVEEDNKEVKTIYGLLNSMFVGKTVFDDGWFNEISGKYKLPHIIDMPAGQIFDDGLNVQRYYVYNDYDGKVSYDSIINQYSAKSNWSIHDKGTYVVIKSKLLSGRGIEIYVNKPEFENKGQSEIQKILNGKKVHIEVHVGHSYHVDKTVKRINAQAALIVLRSCGGYNEVSVILHKVSGAHIISTKGMGTMYVNDPLLYLLNNEILKGKDIIWQDFWSKAEKILGDNENFKNYIAPHKNLSVLFLKAYSKITNSESKYNMGHAVFGSYTARQNTVFARLISIEEKMEKTDNFELKKMYKAQIDYLRDEFNSLENTRRLQPAEAMFAVNQSPLSQHFNGSMAIRICP